MSKMNVAEYISRWISLQGITHVFGITGGPVVPMFKALKENTDLNVIMPCHEQSAAFMADGYARISRNMGVCFVTTGPGTTNALTGLYSAFMDNSPVLLFTGQTVIKSFGQGSLQDSSGVGKSLDSKAAFSSVALMSDYIISARQLPNLLSLAWNKMKTGQQGTAHLSITADALSEFTSDIPVLSSVPSLPIAPRNVIEQIKEKLFSSQNPVILAGNGVRKSQASELLIRFAEALKIPVITTLKGKSVFPENHPLALGVHSTFTSKGDYLLSPEIDLVLILGSSLSETTTGKWPDNLTHDRSFIRIDIDFQSIGNSTSEHLLVTADVGEVLKSLLETIGDTSFLHKSLPHESFNVSNAHMLQKSASILKPQAVVSMLSALWPEKAKLFVDAGNCLSWVGDFFQARHIDSSHIPIGSGTMGASLPMAIGGKCAAPELLHAVIMGDGAFMMTGFEISTAVNSNHPILVVVLNNGGHGTAYAGEHLLWEQEVFSKFHRPIDIAALAQSMGATGKIINTLGELELELQAGFSSEETTVLDVRVDIDEIPSAIEGRVNTLKAYFGGEHES